MAIDGVSLVGKELRAVTDMLRGEAGKKTQSQKKNPEAVTDMLQRAHLLQKVTVYRGR